MKRKLSRHLFVVVWLFSIFIAPIAQAQSGNCGFIRNNDLQAMCRAETGAGSRQCGLYSSPRHESRMQSQNALTSASLKMMRCSI